MGDLKEYLQLVYSQELEKKKQWYSSVAQAYDRARPHYSQSLLQVALEWANLSPTSTILEVGCGPGTATVDLAQFGYPIVALEPSIDAGELARQNCQSYPHVTLINSTLEEWELGDREFDIVVAASSYHWISPQVREEKIISCFPGQGTLILLWNTPPRPEADVYDILNSVYQKYDPSLATYDDLATHQQSLHEMGQSLLVSGNFRDLRSQQVMCDRRYDIDTYLTLLTTLSQYIRLDSAKRNQILSALKLALQQKGITEFNTSYLSLVQVVSYSS
ncbi:class I SAM-dependent methyltransferase [Roseofilum casamattae]|uniref:Class I SAM-dependent methyltransferase n=1 Tax=Roseofilum casamattae BLCC-M143 TaxID=3022442 RepID=A0ABT7C2C5_9CYAN|nr:class I SAM-dependent methyltransferase [Roseofilum casamattae]MDJ1185594.1 class I SAM-dependent methyltransferase [Roseofilum casamattae BLCC-M143]